MQVYPFSSTLKERRPLSGETEALTLVEKTCLKIILILALILVLTVLIENCL